MRTGIPLSTIRKEVQIEAGFSTESGHSVFSKERIDQLISRHERMMAREHGWPGVQFEETVTVAAERQYVSLPTNINYTDINEVSVLYGDQWLPVTYGIGRAERSSYTNAERATPIQRWEVVAPGNVELEVWPIGGIAQTLLFTGSKTLGGFADDTSTCTLDADVIVLRVAAEILGRDRKEDAALKLDLAKRLTNDIIKAQASTRRSVNMGGGSTGRRLRPGIDYIPSGSG